MYIAASAPGICETFPNINVAVRIYLCMLVTNCSGERSFSVLSRVKKNEINTTMSDECLNALSLMAVKSNIVRSFYFESVINWFESSKARREKFKSNLIVCSSRCSANGSRFTLCALKPAYCIILAPC